MLERQRARGSRLLPWVVTGLGLDATGVAEAGDGVTVNVKLSAGGASGQGLVLALGWTTA